jgi:PAS domain S-box-containing protein
VNPETLDPDLSSAVFQSDPVGIAVIASPGTIAWANPAYFATTGRDRTILGRDFHGILEDDGTWSKEIQDAIDEVLRGGKTVTFQSVRARYRHQSGGTFLDVDVVPLSVAYGRPAHAVLMLRDATERVQQHLQARLFYESFRTSTNTMQLTDARGLIVDVNPAYERVYGYTRAECLGRKSNLVRSKDTPDAVYREMWEDLLDPRRGYWSGEISNRDRSGRDRPVLLSITAIRDETGSVSHYLGVTVDLSEQRSWEMRSVHADKLASIGQLAAGVAHEINTPLANLMLLAESTRTRTSDPEVQARLDKMIGQIEVAAVIVRGLLDFARQGVPALAPVDLVLTTKETLKFLKGKQSADLEIVTSFEPGGVPVTGDRRQLMQVVTNLLNNASDAMEGRGVIDVSVRARGGRAELEIIDHGTGIPAEVLPKLFEPFFTTKPEGEGTGLGLAISHGIVAAHHGSIVARNVAGAGAGFLVSLPLLRPTPLPPVGEPA